MRTKWSALSGVLNWSGQYVAFAGLARLATLIRNSRLPLPIDGGSATATHCRSRDASPVVSSPVGSVSTWTPGTTHGFGAGPATTGATSFDGADSPTELTAVRW